MSRHFRYRAWLVTVVFIAAIALPIFDKNFSLSKDIESFENRKMAEKPVFKVAKLDPFPGKYEPYYNDHFPLRNRLIRLHNIYKIICYRRSPIPDKVVIAKDGWLFPIGDEMDSYLGKRQLTREELQALKNELEYRQRYLAERGCKLYYLIVPCKASVHGDKIGYEYFRMKPQSWGEHVNEYLKKNSTVNVVDVFNELREKKKKHQLYYKLDNHWNQVGAFYTCSALISHIAKDFPALKPMDENDFYVEKGGPQEGNMSLMLGDLGIYEEFSTQFVPHKGFKATDAPKAGYKPVEGFSLPDDFERVKKIDGSSAPTMMLICDSFGNSFFPFVAEYFSKTVKIWDCWQYKLNPEIVEGEKPDIMVIMVDEPIIRNLLEHPARPGGTVPTPPAS